MNAGPGVDFGLANLAFETAGTCFRMLLFGRSVIDPAIGAGEKLGGPYAAGHPAKYAPMAFRFKPLSPPQLTNPQRKGWIGAFGVYARWWLILGKRP
jgi:hypothetical protein